MLFRPNLKSCEQRALISAEVASYSWVTTHLTEIILQIQVIKLKTFSCSKVIEQVKKSLFRNVRSIKFYRARIATSKYYNNNKCMEYPKKCIALSGYSTASYVISLSLLLDCSPILVLSKQKTYEFRKPVANQSSHFHIASPKPV